MIPFEIHITGEKNILKELDSWGIKNITVELLKPNLNVLREEYMSSYIITCNYDEIHGRVLTLLNALHSKIFRVKIECPPRRELFPLSIYMESHFTTNINKVYPASRNKKSKKIMCTDREYNKNNYTKFMQKYKGIADVELCIFDSWKEEDLDWFNLYSKK